MSESIAHLTATTFFWIIVVLLAAKIGSIVEKIGQPAVLGEIIAGVVLGNLALAGIPFFEPLKHSMTLHFLAELGVVILLFQVGLETSLQDMAKVGKNAFLVAVVGVVIPFVLGMFVVGPLLMPGMSFNAYLFLGATLTATSVGITARVFKDLKKLHTPEAKIVLGAAVIDDVLGLIILAVVSVIVTSGAVSLGLISWIVAKALFFLIGVVLLGKFILPSVYALFSRIHSGVAAKFVLALCTCLVLAYAASRMDLAPIVGAFAAGLVLTADHFKTFDKPEQSIAHMFEPVGYFLVPIFFVMTGMAVRLETLSDASVVFVALGVTAAAILGKVVAGFAAGPGVSKSIVGWGMVPRGEVGLIFASIGMGLGVVNPTQYSVIVLMVMLTTLITPPLLTLIIRRKYGTVLG